jgi:hypothetical protein
MKPLRTHTIVLAVLLAAVLPVVGCIYFPTFWTKDKYTQKDLTGFTANISTKDDVFKKFGQPNIVWETEGIYVYKWQKLQGILFVGAGYQGDFAAVQTDKAMFIQFDQDDHVKRIELAAKKSFESYGDFLMRWRNENRIDR